MPAGTIDRVIEDRPEAARYYMGLVFWRPGELETSSPGACGRSAAPTPAFRGDTEGLWNELSRAGQGVWVRAGSSFPRSPGT